MGFELVVLLIVAGLFLGVLASIEVGRRLGLARLVRDPQGLAKGVGAAEGAVFALLGLMLAFAFSGAASKFEDRRFLITDEANAIGTAWLRLDLLPADAQPELRTLFRRYVDLRLAVYTNVEDEAATLAKLQEGAALQGQIWSLAVAAGARPEARQPATMLLLPALNEMIDITATRTAAARNHPPLAVFLLLGTLALAGSLLVGYNVAVNPGRSWIHSLSYAAAIALSVYVILDLEYPRLGLIRIDKADQLLVDVRRSMD
jgi:hypothetical protein